MPDCQPLYDAVLRGDATTARSATEQALADGASPLSLVHDSMMPAMVEVGRRFECNDYFVPELLLAARAMKSALELIRPHLAAAGNPSAGRVVIGTVKGDLHDIGKNLVIAMLEGAGYEIIDLGINVPPARFVAAIRDKQPAIVALSALLTTTLPNMKATIDAIREAGLRDRVKILIGGAPVTRRYAEEIGADGYAETAVGAVGLAKNVLPS
ncbi:MAG: corrinoid protein [Verrucomicrobiota bacterium]